jgi:hypothetical protein
LAPLGVFCAICRFQHRLHRVDLVALEGAQMIGQAPRQFAEQLPIGKNADQRRHIFEGPRRAHLNGQAAARFVVADHRSHGVANAKDGAILQCACSLFGLDAIVRQQRAIDIVAERFGFRRDQIAPDPSPDRLNRDAG